VLIRHAILGARCDDGRRRGHHLGRRAFVRIKGIVLMVPVRCSCRARQARTALASCS
jgi:hypothetical protein